MRAVRKFSGNMRDLLSAGLFFMTFIFGPPALAAVPTAAPDVETLLKRVFDNYRSKSSETSVGMTIHCAGWERHLAMKAWTRGMSDALVRFTAPHADAGNATLKLGDETWIFNPKLEQVIRLPASMMSQSWMGSDFSYDDLSKSDDLLTEYAHRLAGSEQQAGHQVWVVDAIPKPGSPVVWGKVTVRIRDDLVMLEETYFDQDGKPVRRMTADDIRVLGGRIYPVIMTMHPLDRPGQWTRIETSDARFDAGLPDYLFTLSNLQNPRP